MRKKLTALLLIAVLMMPFIPKTAHAASYSLSGNTSFNIDVITESSVINIASGSNVRLYSLTGEAVSHLRINCGDNVILTLENVYIEEPKFEYCPITFTGTGNILVIEGDNTLEAGDDNPGIRVETGTALQIQGSGTLDVTGGSYAAAIGGGNGYGSGDITFDSGKVIAQGGTNAGTIGGGYQGTCGNVTLSTR